MEDLDINIYAFLGVLEFSLLLLVVSLVFFLRSRSLAGRLRILQARLKKAGELPEPVTFEQYLRDEVIRNQTLIDSAAASQDDAEKQAAELMRMRKQFLELEVEARSLENNPVEFQNRLAGGFNELIEQWRPEPETVTETVLKSVETAAEAETASEAEADAPEQPKALDTHDAEFDRLKQVINNQQDAMEALRRELQAREGEIDDMAAVMGKLDEFERQSAELQQCLDVLEKENDYLKRVRVGGGEANKTQIREVDSAQLTGLKSMVGRQQATISNLQNLIHELAPEAGKAKELQQAIEEIRRSNQELNGCVAVLEDENAMLRAELEEIQMHLDEQENSAAEAPASEAAAASEQTGAEDDSALEEEKNELEIKVQELEALVEFKDAAIEELEKQYSKLEAKYLAASGEKQVV
jgi:chromosome segregation ATPase